MKNKIRQALFRYAPPEAALALRQLKQRVRGQAGRSPFPTRNLVSVESIPGGPALILAPHPDDEVIGCGGALRQLLEKKAPVSVLYLTDGRGPGAVDLSLAKTRRREAEKLGRQYGFKQIFWDVPDNRLSNTPETVAALAQLLERLRPKMVFAPSFFDHQFDHFAANLVLVDALKTAAWKDLSVLGYEVWDNLPFPNYLVDISGQFEAKAEMLRCYRVPNAVTDFVHLCRCRGVVHFLLYIDSARREPEGCAEAFYRLDARTYADLVAAYQEILLTVQSPLLTRRFEPHG